MLESDRMTGDEMLEVIHEAIEIGMIEPLTAWETEFLDSIEIQRSKGRELSFKQMQILRRIYGKVN